MSHQPQPMRQGESHGTVDWAPERSPPWTEGFRKAWGSATRSLSHLFTLWRSLGPAGQAVVIVPHTLFHGQEVGAILPPVGKTQNPASARGQKGTKGWEVGADFWGSEDRGAPWCEMDGVLGHPAFTSRAAALQNMENHAVLLSVQKQCPGAQRGRYCPQRAKIPNTAMRGM